MSHAGTHLGPQLPPPNGWVMGVVAIGAGITLWWLTPDIVRRTEAASRQVWGERSPWARSPNSLRKYYDVSNRLGSLVMVLMGIAILGVQIARL